jgi:hypothetical protein
MAAGPIALRWLAARQRELLVPSREAVVLGERPKGNWCGMQVKKAVITAAGRTQRNLPLQTLFDEQGTERSVLSLVVREAVRAGIDDICIIVWPAVKNLMPSFSRTIPRA